MALMRSGVKSGFLVDKVALLLREKTSAQSRLDRLLSFAGACPERLSVVDEDGPERAIAVDLPAQEVHGSHMDTFREPRQVARDLFALGR